MEEMGFAVALKLVFRPHFIKWYSTALRLANVSAMGIYKPGDGNIRWLKVRYVLIVDPSESSCNTSLPTKPVLSYNFFLVLVPQVLVYSVPFIPLWSRKLN